MRIKYNRKDPSLTMISALRKEFLSKEVSNDSVYTKWYSDEELEAISAELLLVHRCIFWDTVFTVHRVDSALSITMETIDLRKRRVSPTRTKTGQSYVSVVPQYLADMIETYIIEERSKVVSRTGSSCKYLFLNRDGNPVPYALYNAALKRAGEQVRLKNTSLNLQNVHTHAGRSTFAAVLRTYGVHQWCPL